MRYLITLIIWFEVQVTKIVIGNSFNDEERCVVSGYDNGDIKMFDLRMMCLKWEANVKSGVIYLLLSVDEIHSVMFVGVFCSV